MTTGRASCSSSRAHDRLRGLPARRGDDTVPGEGLLRRDRPADRSAGPHRCASASRTAPTGSTRSSPTCRVQDRARHVRREEPDRGPNRRGRSTGAPGGVRPIEGRALRAVRLLDTTPSFHPTEGDIFNPHRPAAAACGSTERTGASKNASKKARQWLVDQIRAEDEQRADEINARVATTSTWSWSTTTVGMGSTGRRSRPLSRTRSSTTSTPTMPAPAAAPRGSSDLVLRDLCDRGYDEVEAAVRVAALASLGSRRSSRRKPLREPARDTHQAAVAAKPRSVETSSGPSGISIIADAPETTVEARDTYAASSERVVDNKTTPITWSIEAPLRHPRRPSTRRPVPGRRIEVLVGEGGAGASSTLRRWPAGTG